MEEEEQDLLIYENVEAMKDLETPQFD